MKRREFITLLGGAVASCPIAVSAQQSAIPLVGYFSGRSSDSEELLLSSFRKGLEEEGFTIGWKRRLPTSLAARHSSSAPAREHGSNSAVLSP
jgi:putative ABC transport system substrate-binding protein